ncbi:uncharacterized protein BDV17DRAFT_73815 [Aspergillus undulatus]|uniref:uncharacterized protein n=1 Tax=Aspergillus undulatus TaxID=1810928 RepID=UPI003CCDE78F
MCFSQNNDDDYETRSVRISKYDIHSHPLRMSFPPRFRRSCYSPPLLLPEPHHHHHHHHHHRHPSRTEDTTIIWNPRHRHSFSSSHCSPPPSPRPSYTTISRRHVHTRRETIQPVASRRTFFGRDRECDAPRYIEYVEREPGSGRRWGWEDRDVECIPCR